MSDERLDVAIWNAVGALHDASVWNVKLDVAQVEAALDEAAAVLH